MSEEGGHWYKRDGSPCYEVPTKDGGLRPVNLRWDRKLGLVPSVTTVLKAWPKPQLVSWQVRQAILAARTIPESELRGLADDELVRRIEADSMQQVRDAANKGTEIHDACEAHFKGRVVNRQHRATVERVAAVVAELFPGVTDWVSEASFAHPIGYGGKVDLHSPSTGIVVDFKGKDGDFTDGKKLAYDQHLQLAAYQEGLLLPPAPCANVFFSRTHSGFAVGHKWPTETIREGLADFLAAFDLWKRWKKYDPSFMQQDKAA